ncbi:MAG: hypothetical protein ACP5NO_07005 [Thermoplasmata archaeon]
MSIVSRYDDYIRDMINRYNLSAVRIYENIREKGYRGSYTTVKRIWKYRYETELGKQAQATFDKLGKIEMEEGQGNSMHSHMCLATQD